MNNDNLDIFIGTYKTFKPPVSNPAYKIIVGNHDIDNDSGLELIKCGNKDDVLDDRFFSEIYMLKYLVKYRQLKDYVGFCHYRKYFSFMDNIPDMDEIFGKCGAIVARPLHMKYNIGLTYGMCHNIEDLAITGVIIKTSFPEYYDAFLNVTNGNILIPYNMTIMKRDDFIRYVNFVGGVLDRYIEIVGTDIEGRIKNREKLYLKDFDPNNTLDYQYRIGGYLAERLTTIFVHKNFKNVMTYPIKITEIKYNIENGKKKQKKLQFKETGETVGNEG